jgi:hypothetical protein
VKPIYQPKADECFDVEAWLRHSLRSLLSSMASNPARPVSLHHFSDAHQTSLRSFSIMMSSANSPKIGDAIHAASAPGAIVVATSGPQPGCDATHRGWFWFAAGGAGVKDTVQVCAKDASNTYAWRTVY